MKIDKRLPGHWMLLLGFFLQSGLGVVARAVTRKREPHAVVLYGHKLNGNLLALHRYMIAHPELGFRPVFLSMDRIYTDELQAIGVDVVLAAGAKCWRLLGSARALVSDHGLHSLQPWRGLYQRLGLTFIDVWHGIPFKGFDADDFRVQHRYDETWVASTFNRDLYVNRFGFPPNRVVATGYARTDPLVSASHEDVIAARETLGLPIDRKLVLFAPTWKQDVTGRSPFPFGCDAQTFLDKVAGVAASYGADVVLRTHLNSHVEVWEHRNIHALPASCYPDAEVVLLACDVLVCDWSSIAFDFLVLDRPAIFLDVEPPFRKGFSLGPEYRYGAIADDLQALSDALELVLARPETYWQGHADRHGRVKQKVYGGFADGRASQRCIQRLAQIVTTGSSR